MIKMKILNDIQTTNKRDIRQLTAKYQICSFQEREREKEEKQTRLTSFDILLILKKLTYVCDKKLFIYDFE